MSDEKYVELLRATVPMLERIKNMPLKEWQFDAEELEVLRLYQTSKPRPELRMQMITTFILSDEQFLLLSDATSLVVTRMVHGIDPLTGEDIEESEKQIQKEAWLKWLATN